MINQGGIEHGVEGIAGIQTIGHLYYLWRYHAFAPLMDTDEVLLADDEAVLRFHRAIFAAIAEGLSSRKIPIGFDEASGTGSGRYKELHSVLVDRKVLLLRHLLRVVEIGREFG